MRFKQILMLFSFVLFGVAIASLDDFIELNDEEIAEMNAELGMDVDIFWAHRDVYNDGNAPIIYLIIYTTEDDGAGVVGSYSAMRDSLRGKSDLYQTLALQNYFGSINSSDVVTESRVAEFEFFDDIPALIVVQDFLDNEYTVYQQIQLMQWSDDEMQKCVIASEMTEKVSAYYADTVSDAIVELVTYCSIGLNAIIESSEHGS